MPYIGQRSVLWQSQDDSDTPKHHGLGAGGSQKLNRTTSVSTKWELAGNVRPHHWPGELCVGKPVVYPYPSRIVVPGQRLYPGALGYDWRILGLSCCCVWVRDATDICWMEAAMRHNMHIEATIV